MKFVHRKLYKLTVRKQILTVRNKSVCKIGRFCLSSPSLTCLAENMGACLVSEAPVKLNHHIMVKESKWTTLQSS